MDFILNQPKTHRGTAIFDQYEERHLISTDLIISDLQSYISGQQHVFPQHDLFYQIVYFKTENGQHMIAFKKKYALKASIIHRRIRLSDDWTVKDAVNGIVINFSELFFGTFLADVNYINDLMFFISNSGYSRFCIDSENQLLVDELIKKINRAYDGGRGNYDLTRVHLLHLLIKLNMRLVLSQSSKISKNYYLHKFEILIEQHFLLKKYPKDYAELLFITPNHLNAVCIQFAGKSAGDMIRSRILLEAKRLLMYSSLTINEIASYLNFDTNSYFSRFFKKEEKISPKSFQKRYNAAKPVKSNN